MPDEELNPGQKAKKANDEFHEAVQDVMLDEELEVTLKVQYASACDVAFRQMTVANDLIKEHYGTGD
ncbi:hypothetical protein LCGC14_1251000 [marine sediment metagenome]|uniref:Uncharacterized protein n=1 Tax=marine sediment metagenome TaxID=412755 RepID=A0A0F9P703_9ZZZZ